MKTFIRKLKNANRILLILFIISIIAYATTYGIFTNSLIHLSGIETGIRIFMIVVFGLYLLAWLLMGLITLFTKKYKPYVIMMVFTVLFIALFSFGSYYINTIYSEISDFSKNTVTYTSDLISLKDGNINENSKIGMINDTNDTEGYVLAKKIISENNLDNEIVTYDDYYAMLNDLYNKKIDGCFVSNNYEVLFGSEDAYQNIGTDVKVVYTHSEEMENKDNVVLTNKKLTEPFTILVMGVDSEDDGLNANQAFNGDTLMLITFNPKTLTSSIFSIPRDTYVPISCRGNNYAKINSSAASGASCVISTIKNLTGIDIDYYVKVNFKGVVDLVNALNGVDVDVAEPYFTFNNGVDYHGQVCEQNSDREFGAEMVCMNPGMQTLSGEQALAYSRDRHQYIGSDLDRIKHQQDVVEAIIDKAKTISTFDQFKDLLNTIQRNIDTNMTTDQILSLYNVAKSVILGTLNGNTTGLSVHKTYLETYSLPVWTGYSTTSALGYYKASLDDITKMMRVNLGLEEEQAATTYEIDYKEDYTTKSYGEGLRSNPQETIMASLIGSSESYAVSLANANGLKADTIKVYPGDEHYNSNYSAGIVGDQSIHIGTLINGYSNIILYVNNQTAVNEAATNETTDTTPNVTPENTDTEKKEKTPVEVLPGGPKVDIQPTAETKNDTVPNQ